MKLSAIILACIQASAASPSIRELQKRVYNELSSLPEFKNDEELTNLKHLIDLDKSVNKNDEVKAFLSE